jgi:LPPG:FO 2-phospho-L-lactate transferase
MIPGLKVASLAGGVGSARFLAGLVRVVEPESLTVVVNTGDDERLRGLHICPDIDTVLYHLSNLCDWDRGWGVAGETFSVNDHYRDLAIRAGDAIQEDRTGKEVDVHEWFALGDRDLATHLLRARFLDVGLSLTEATDRLRRAMGVECRVLPMSDTPVRTVLLTQSGEALDFQEYFVRRGQREEVARVSFVGAAEARVAPGATEAVASADLVVVPPSNPLISIAPILAVPALREAMAGAPGTRVAVSPIVGGRALKGPADRLLASMGHEVSALGVARMYRGLVDVFVIDERDAGLSGEIEALGMRTVVCDTIMRSAEDAARLAKTVLAEVRP